MTTVSTREMRAEPDEKPVEISAEALLPRTGNRHVLIIYKQITRAVTTVSSQSASASSGTKPRWVYGAPQTLSSRLSDSRPVGSLAAPASAGADYGAPRQLLSQRQRAGLAQTTVAAV